jgi:hypothetical protein
LCNAAGSGSAPCGNVVCGFTFDLFNQGYSMPEADHPIEQAYRDAIGGMSPAKRVARGQSLFNWARECMARQIVAEHQATGGDVPLDPQVLKLLVGRRMYSGDPLVCEWIDRLVSDVSR